MPTNMSTTVHCRDDPSVEGYRNGYDFIDWEHKKCILIQQQQQSKFLERFSDCTQNISDVPKSENLAYFTKIIVATWFFDEIIPIAFSDGPKA